MSAGKAVLGYLYNFVDQGRVYNYSRGTTMSFARTVQPAWVRHARLRRGTQPHGGHHIYDFMAGDSEYKQTLGLASSDMFGWWRQRSRLRFALEDYLAQDLVEATSDHLGEAQERGRIGEFPPRGR